jgi:putative transposase
MPYRKEIFSNNEIYHIVNRGVAQQPIFSNKKDYLRFLAIIDFYRYTNPSLSFSHYNRLEKEEREKFLKKLKKNNQLLVEILAFCLLPNHFHLLLKQLKEKGIPIFLRNLQNSYARYFNIKSQRIGPLFQSIFKAVRIETTEQLLHVCRYIHLNPSSSYIVEIKKLEDYPWSSLPEYLNLKKPLFVKPEIVMNHFKNKEEYRRFIFDQAEYQRELTKIKHLVLE